MVIVEIFKKEIRQFHTNSFYEIFCSILGLGNEHTDIHNKIHLAWTK